MICLTLIIVFLCLLHCILREVPKDSKKMVEIAVIGLMPFLTLSAERAQPELVLTCKPVKTLKY